MAEPTFEPRWQNWEFFRAHKLVNSREGQLEKAQPLTDTRPNGHWGTVFTAWVTYPHLSSLSILGWLKHIGLFHFGVSKENPQTQPQVQWICHDKETGDIPPAVSMSLCPPGLHALPGSGLPEAPQPNLVHTPLPSPGPQELGRQAFACLCPLNRTLLALADFYFILWACAQIPPPLGSLPASSRKVTAGARRPSAFTAPDFLDWSCARWGTDEQD